MRDYVYESELNLSCNEAKWNEKQKAPKKSVQIFKPSFSQLKYERV